MNEVKIELDSAGIMQLLSSAEIQSYVTEIANNCVNSCSGNYEVQSTVKSGRAVANIKTADRETYYKNLKSNELIKATGPNKRHR